MKLNSILPVVFLIAGLSFQQANAQSPIFIGIKGGIGIPNLHSNSSSEVSSGYSSRLGAYFGVFGDFGITGRFSIQPEINYSSQGGKKNGEQAIPANQFDPEVPAGMLVYANYNSVAELNYIEVPVLAKFTFPLNKKLHFFLDAGPYAGYLFHAKNITSGSSPIYLDKEEQNEVPGIGKQNFNSNTDIKDQLKKMNFGIQAGVGLSLEVGKGYAFVEGGGNYGLVEIQKNPQVDGKDHTGAATVVVGYALRIN